ncbi:m7GpppX diphosphatase [Cucumispora dikerogammari]|nr:m7GpppX diphosphatase [Cucumispora dikerogammari]
MFPNNFKDLKIEQHITNGIIGIINDTKLIIIFNAQNITKNIALKLKDAEIIKENISNPPFYNLSISIDQVIYNIRLTYPAEPSDLKKHENKKILFETYEMYLKTPKTIPTWVTNIINKKVEIPLFENDKFLILKDIKWNGNIDDLYLTLFYKDFSLYSIREIELNHILEALPPIEETLNTFGLKKEDCLMYFHYKPSYYLLHMHVFNLKGEFTSAQSVGRAILIQDIIRNLEIDKDYYKKAVMWFAG